MSGRRGPESGRTGRRFVLVGIVNTLFGLLIFAGLELLVGDTVPYLVVLVAAHVVNVTEAFLTQRLLVFRAQGHWWGDYARFWSVQLASLAINATLLPLLVEIVGLPVLLAQAVVVTLIAAGSFWAHKNFTFRGLRQVRPSPVDRVSAR